MKKIILIAWKDFTITYRDVTALLLIIAAPLAMTLVMNFAFGGSSTGFSPVPIAVINQDSGMLGDIFEGALTSEEIKEYLLVTPYDSFEAAAAQLESDRLAAVVVIPESGFDSFTTFSQAGSEDFTAPEDTTIKLYVNPVRPISALIVEAVLDSVLIQLNTAMTAGTLGFSDLLQQNAITPQQLQDGMGETLGMKLEPLFTENRSAIRLETESTESNNQSTFSWLSYMAPSMAILFLAFSMNASSRSILSEREKGTLPRLLMSPNRPSTILIGKMLGTFLVGFIQVFIFILLSSLLLKISWGPILQLLLFTIAIVLAVASWGIFVASIARNSGEASAIGTAVLLVFAALAGNFIPRNNFPEWLKTLGYVTPNAWGIEGYLQMINGATFGEIYPSILALTGMAILLLALSSLFFQRQYRHSV